MATATQYTISQVSTQINFLIYGASWPRHYLYIGVLKYKWSLKPYYIEKYDFFMKITQKMAESTFKKSKKILFFFQNVKHFLWSRVFVNNIYY